MAAIKLLLLEDVEGLGRAGDIVNAAPGHARNFLFPRKKAITADKRALNMQEKLQEARRNQAIADKQEAESVNARINDQTVKTQVKVDHEGHMYGSVSLLDILQLVKEQLNIELEKKNVVLAQPIKTLGSHTVTVKLKEGVVSKFVVEVTSEDNVEQVTA